MYNSEGIIPVYHGNSRRIPAFCTIDLLWSVRKLKKDLLGAHTASLTVIVMHLKIRGFI